MARSPETTGPFTHLPLLPVVPPPVAGETLSGWVTAVGGIYGLTAAGLLQTMGVAAPQRLRRLDINPAAGVLTALSAQTGVDRTFMQARMTFHGLDCELVPAVLAATPHCPHCAALRTATGRKVELLQAIAPWEFACDRHVPTITADERDPAVDVTEMRRDLACFSACLGRAACREVGRPFATIEGSAAACLRLVEALNDRLRLRVRTGPDGAAIFDLAERRDDAVAAEPRNSRAVSAWYAWRVTSTLDRMLQRSPQHRDRVQLRRLLLLLFNLLPPQGPHAARLAGPPATDDPPPFSPQWLTGSPFTAADLRWHLLPSLPPLLSDLVLALLGPALDMSARIGLAPTCALVATAQTAPTNELASWYAQAEIAT